MLSKNASFPPCSTTDENGTDTGSFPQKRKQGPSDGYTANISTGKKTKFMWRPHFKKWQHCFPFLLDFHSYQIVSEIFSFCDFVPVCFIRIISCKNTGFNRFPDAKLTANSIKIIIITDIYKKKWFLLQPLPPHLTPTTPAKNSSNTKVKFNFFSQT